MDKEASDFLDALRLNPEWVERLRPKVEEPRPGVAVQLADPPRSKNPLKGLSAHTIAMDEAKHFLETKRVNLGLPQQLGQRERVMGPAEVWSGAEGLWDKTKVADVPDGQEWTFITARSWNEATRVSGPVVWHIASRQPVIREVFLPLPADVGQVVKVKGPARVSFETRSRVVAQVPGECEWEFVATIREKRWAWIWSTGGTTTAQALSDRNAPEELVPKTLEERIRDKMRKRWGTT